MDVKESVDLVARSELRPPIVHGLRGLALRLSHIAPVDDEQHLQRPKFPGEVIVHHIHLRCLMRHDQYLRVDNSTKEGSNGKLHPHRQHPNPNDNLWDNSLAKKTAKKNKVQHIQKITICEELASLEL